MKSLARKGFLVLFGSLCASLFAMAQVPRAGDDEYMVQGRLVILKFVPKDQKAKLFFAGKKTGEIDFKKDHKILTITAFDKQSKKEILSFSKDGEAFEITNLPSWKKPYELEIRTETKGQIEDFKIEVKTKP